MKVILLITVLTWYSHGSSSVQTTVEMNTLEQCVAVKKGLLEIVDAEPELSNSKVSAICLEIPK